MKKLLLLLPVLLLIAYGCSTTEQSLSDDTDGKETRFTDEDSSNDEMLASLRTTLADAYSNKQNKIPEGFNRIKVKQEVQKNIYEGYRIQIFSGEDVIGADTTAGNFRAWADTTLSGYQPDTYVFFKTPYFRVHVGDFHNRDKAIQVSNLVKRYFKDAWVVYDNVNPEKVPADTTTIELIRKEDQ